MKRFGALAGVFLLLAFSLSVLGQEGEKGQGPEEAAQQQAMMEAMMPGPVHAALKKQEGDWIAEYAMYMGGPEPTKSTGTAKNQMILGGRYLRSVHTGEFMGMPFEGIGVTGYDNVKGHIVSTWMDNMGTSITFGEGSFDSASGAMTTKGTMVDPMTKGDMAYRTEAKWVDANTMLFTMYMDMGGQEVKAFDITYKRK